MSVPFHPTRSERVRFSPHPTSFGASSSCSKADDAELPRRPVFPPGPKNTDDAPRLPSSFRAIMCTAGSLDHIGSENCRPLERTSSCTPVSQREFRGLLDEASTSIQNRSVQTKLPTTRLAAYLKSRKTNVYIRQAAGVSRGSARTDPVELQERARQRRPDTRLIRTRQAAFPI